MSQQKLCESVLGTYPAGAGEVHESERAQLPLSKLAFRHAPAGMYGPHSYIDGGWGGRAAAEGVQGTPESRPSLTQRTRSQARSHSNILCDKHYKGDL